MNDFAQAMKSAESWYSEDTEPDPTPLPGVCGYNLLVKPLGIKEKHNGIFIPQSAREDAKSLTNVARVLAIGPEAYKGGKFESSEPWCKVGDYIVFSKFRGVKIAYKTVPLTLIADDEVLMVVADSSDINNTFFSAP